MFPRPGEITLAGKGVLFLDEMTEFKPEILEGLRQPLEDKDITIVRMGRTYTYPADFMLVGAMNPCKCGYLGDPRHKCRCSPRQIQDYRARLSGPLLDRIDIHVEASALPVDELRSKGEGEPSAEINASMDAADIRKYCALDDEQASILSAAMEELNLSARAWDRILKVSRTIADLDSSEKIQTHHLFEAINYRSLDRTV